MFRSVLVAACLLVCSTASARLHIAGTNYGWFPPSDTHYVSLATSHGFVAGYIPPGQTELIIPVTENPVVLSDLTDGIAGPIQMGYSGNYKTVREVDFGHAGNGVDFEGMQLQYYRFLLRGQLDWHPTMPYYRSVRFEVWGVPEPGSLLLLGCGLFVLAARRWR